jgi:hypothetical protein
MVVVRAKTISNENFFMAVFFGFSGKINNQNGKMARYIIFIRLVFEIGFTAIGQDARCQMPEKKLRITDYEVLFRYFAVSLFLP